MSLLIGKDISIRKKESAIAVLSILYSIFRGTDKTFPNEPQWRPALSFDDETGRVFDGTFNDFAQYYGSCMEPTRCFVNLQCPWINKFQAFLSWFCLKTLGTDHDEIIPSLSLWPDVPNDNPGKFRVNFLYSRDLINPMVACENEEFLKKLISRVYRTLYEWECLSKRTCTRQPLKDRPLNYYKYLSIDALAYSRLLGLVDHGVTPVVYSISFDEGCEANVLKLLNNEELFDFECDIEDFNDLQSS